MLQDKSALADTDRSNGRRRVLLVDDNYDASSIMQLLLEMEGHEVATATDGQSALDAAESYKPDVVVLDLGLPDISGYDVAQQLRKRKDFADVLLIALSGRGEEEDREKSRRCGFNHHLVKPADVNDLVALF